MTKRRDVADVKWFWATATLRRHEISSLPFSPHTRTPLQHDGASDLVTNSAEICHDKNLKHVHTKAKNVSYLPQIRSSCLICPLMPFQSLPPSGPL